MEIVQSKFFFLYSFFLSHRHVSLCPLVCQEEGRGAGNSGGRVQ